VAVVGNDHRLGAQEAPPAVLSLYTGETLHQHLRSVIAGGPMDGFSSAMSKTQSWGNVGGVVDDITTGIDDRNRTAPFPFCGNRFEFRGVGSSQNIAMPLSFLDTAMADGLAQLNNLIESGMSVRDACAQTLEKHDAVIFNGDGYNAEWLVEAERRGLPNNSNMVDAWRNFDSEKNIDLFSRMGVYSAREVAARKEIALAEYTNELVIESEVAVSMAQSQYIPALAKDLQAYSGPSAGLAGSRPVVYNEVAAKTSELVALNNAFPHDSDTIDQAEYCLNVLKPACLALRNAVDAAEGLCERSLWPVPTYEEMTLQIQSQ